MRSGDSEKFDWMALSAAGRTHRFTSEGSIDEIMAIGGHKIHTLAVSAGAVVMREERLEEWGVLY